MLPLRTSGAAKPTSLDLSAAARRERGIEAVILLLAPWVLAAAILAWLPLLGTLVALGLLYLAIGARSLAEHAEAVATALEADDLPLARQRVGMIVSRDTDELDEEGISRATVESVLDLFHRHGFPRAAVIGRLEAGPARAVVAA